MSRTQSKFGAYVRKYRTEAGLSLRALAIELGISAPFLSLVERGIHGPLKPKYWIKLIKSVPAIDDATLLALYLNESKEDRAMLTALGKWASGGNGGSAEARVEALRKVLTARP